MKPIHQRVFAPDVKAPQKRVQTQAKKADAKSNEPVDWRDQLAAYGENLEMRAALGLPTAVSAKEAGEIVERVLGDTSPTEDLGVIADRKMAADGLLPEFTSPAIKQAKAVKQAAGMDHKSIVDLRNLPMISTDNGVLNPQTGLLEDASKDIDQVEYAEQMPNGNIKMLVGIADVDSLVKKGSPADQHAMRQTATVYTDKKIFPMLDRRFSEDLTSLNEGEDRLVVVKEFQVTPEGAMTGGKVYRAIVNNRAQLAYDSVNEYLTDGNGAKPPQLSDPVLAEQIDLQDQAAQRLRGFFHSKGSLDIESSETKSTFDNDKVVGMKRERQTQAKDKVKYNMMAGNMTSMRVLDDAGYPTLRRVVKTPEKWDKIVDLAKKYNYRLPQDPDAKALNAFLESRKEASPEKHEDLCSRVVMLVGRGEYVVSTPGEPIEGHFALSAADYGHTTAPNRRAADLINQRIEKAYAMGEDCPYSPEELAELATHLSGQEKVIQNVERKVHRAAEAKLMKLQVGKKFKGRYSREVPIGTLVRLNDIRVTGMIRQKIEGEPGDELFVKLDSVNVEKGHLDFSLAEPDQVAGFKLSK